eukprot:59896-Pyramimonas_sp.AAC.1
MAEVEVGPVVVFSVWTRGSPVPMGPTFRGLAHNSCRWRLWKAHRIVAQGVAGRPAMALAVKITVAGSARNRRHSGSRSAGPMASSKR